MCVCVCVCVCVCIYIYIYKHTHINIHAHIQSPCGAWEIDLHGFWARVYHRGAFIWQIMAHTHVVVELHLSAQNT
jgi:hypothetical protein